MLNKEAVCNLYKVQNEFVLHPNTKQRMKRINLEVFDTIVNLPSIPSVDPSAIPVYDTVFIQQLFEYEQEVHHSVENSKPENKSITFQKKIDFFLKEKKKKTFIVTT